MGFFDKLKSVVNAVTGGAARVTIQLQQSCVFPGETVEVKITATSTGAEVQSKGAYVDVFAEERVSFSAVNNVGAMPPLAPPLWISIVCLTAEARTTAMLLRFNDLTRVRERIALLSGLDK